LGIEENKEDLLAFYIDLKEPEKTEPVFKISIISVWPKTPESVLQK
jgi:hypothetical protein